MPGQKKKRRTVRLTPAADPDRLSTEQYKQAWELFAAGEIPKKIRRIVGLSGPQLFQLYSKGLPARGGRRKGLIGFEQRLAEEQAAIRTEAVAAGKTMSTVGVRYLDKAFRNADTAETITAQILRMQAERLQYQLTLPVAKRLPLSEILFDDAAMKALRVLHTLSGKAKDAAEVYRKIYNDPVAVHPATRAALNLAGKGANGPALPGAGKESLPAAFAFLDSVAGDGASNLLMEEMAKEMSGWTAEQLDRYATTGEEPNPNDVQGVIDV